MFQRELKKGAGCLGCLSPFIIIISAIGGLFLFRSVQFDNPACQVMAGAVILAKGNLIVALGLIAITQVLVFKILSVLPMIWTRFYFTHAHEFTPEAERIRDMHGKLRQMFAGDAERIAFYENRLYDQEGKPLPKRVYMTSLGGCFSNLVLFPSIVVFITLIFFDGLLRMFSESNTPRQILAIVGSLASALSPHLPLPGVLFGVDLDARNFLNLILLVPLGMLVLMNWFLRNVSISGWTIPRGGLHRLTLILFGIGLVFAGAFMNGLLLIYAVVFQVVALLSLIFERLLWDSLYLRLRGFLLNYWSARKG